MSNKYREHFLDFPDPHESNEFFVRIQQVFSHSHHTVQSLSDAINVPKRTLQRFLNKETHNDTIRMVYDFAYACGVRPEVLFDRSLQIANLDLTGIKTIDKMLVDCYNDTSQTGVDGFSRYISNNYRLRHDRWRRKTNGKNNRITSLLSEDEDGRLGLTYENEKKLNQESGETNKLFKRLQLNRAYIVCDLIVVQYVIYELKQDDFSQSKVALKHIDHLKLERPIDDYIENTRLVPKIDIRQWSQVKDPALAVDTQLENRDSMQINYKRG